MRSSIMLIAISVLFISVTAASAADDVVDLSTLGKKSAVEPIALPQVSPNMPTYASQDNASPSNVIDLSTLNKKKQMPSVPAMVITSPQPLTLTPSFSIRNANISGPAPTTFTLPVAIGSNATTTFTLPIAIFGGA